MKRPNLLVLFGLLVNAMFTLSFQAIPQSNTESKNVDRDASKAARDAMKAYKDKDYYAELSESVKSFNRSPNNKNLKIL